MAKMARAHTSGQHALSCTTVDPGQLLAAEWRLKNGGHRMAALSPERGLGAEVSVRLAEWKLDTACGMQPSLLLLLLLLLQ